MPVVEGVPPPPPPKPLHIIAIVIGHGPVRDKGAQNPDGTTELGWNTGLAAMMVEAIGTRAKAVIVHRVTERLQPVAETNATGAAAAVELHLNSFNGRASGTEMIHAAGSTQGKALATLLQRAAVSALGLPDRGIKGPQGGGRGQRWLKGTRMPAVIVETAFIDNDGDLTRANSRKAALATAYADALVEFVGGLGIA